jgi:hypothetical protein
MQIQFNGLPQSEVSRIRSDKRDSYGLPVEKRVSDGSGIPCRFCLGQTPAGQDYLIFAHRPFQGLNAYTETGPIFLCAEDCVQAAPSGDLPAMLASPQYIARGYTDDERIEYGTGKVIETTAISDYARSLLADCDIAFVDIRSASNNCFQCRITRTA